MKKNQIGPNFFIFCYLKKICYYFFQGICFFQKVAQRVTRSWGQLSSPDGRRSTLRVPTFHDLAPTLRFRGETGPKGPDRPDGPEGQAAAASRKQVVINLAGLRHLANLRFGSWPESSRPSTGPAVAAKVGSR